MLQETASRLRSWFLGIQEHDDGKETGRQDALPRLVHLHLSVRCAALARLSRVNDLPLACSTGHEHEEKSVHGRASQRGKTLAEAEDYSHVKRNVNGYFELMKKLPRVTWINAEYKF